MKHQPSPLRLGAIAPFLLALTCAACGENKEDHGTVTSAGGGTGFDGGSHGDSSVGRECQPGDERVCRIALGNCTEGKERCEGGYWSSCSGTGPSAELCDGQDNDCDGDIDEGCECEADAARACGLAVGECKAGMQQCAGRRWGSCGGSTGPESETCDGKDNDCDGDVDEGFDLDAPCSLPGGCPQRRVCSADGRSTVCRNDEGLFEAERCDGIDNDCNGLIDRVVENGSLRSVCSCRTSTLGIGDATDVSIANGLNLCAPTRCGGDRIPGRSLDGKCWPVCESRVDGDGDGWAFENGASCMVDGGDPWRRGKPCEGEGIPVGMSIRYCLDCGVTDDLPYAMCQSLPKFDLTAFVRGEMWLKVDYTYGAEAPAQVPVNLWIDAGDKRRKHLPLVKVGDLPGRYERLLRIEDACFTPSALLGSGCVNNGQRCSHCGGEEVCGAVAECGDYDSRQTWLQIAAEFCGPGIGQQAGAVTVHRVELVEPNCAD